MSDPKNAARPTKHWPAWVDDVLAHGPIAELELEWQAAIADHITYVLDLRRGSRETTCPCCGATRIVPALADGETG